MKKNRFAILALAVSAFAIGMTEFISVGLLPLIQREYNITIALAGLTVSMYALGVTIGAPVLTPIVSYSNQVIVRGHLSTIEEDVREAAPEDAPGILLVGDAIGLTEGATYIESDHLPEYFGKQCIVTGDREAAIEKAFEIYDAGGFAMIDPNNGDTYHQSQLDLIYRFMQMDDITEIVKA